MCIEARSRSSTAGDVPGLKASSEVLIADAYKPIAIKGARQGEATATRRGQLEFSGVRVLLVAIFVLC